MPRRHDVEGVSAARSKPAGAGPFKSYPFAEINGAIADSGKGDAMRTLRKGQSVRLSGLALGRSFSPAQQEYGTIVTGQGA
jgi:hypothetical protein